MKAQVGNRIKSARMLAGLSLRELSTALDGLISHTAISKYEKGEMMPDSKVLIALSKTLDVKTDYFLRPQTVEISQIAFRKKSSLTVKKTNSIKENIKDNIERYIELERLLDLNEYIHHQVSQDKKKNLAICFVAINDKEDVIGYYTLTSESLGRSAIPEQYLKQVPKNYNAPVILLGRLARDLSAKGTGLGEYLLLNALFRCFYLSNKSIGAMAVVVDPLNQYAVDFYKKYGFEQLPDSGRMFLPMKVIAQLNLESRFQPLQ
jgi:transcriptional regulator with XRE-family HTH domain